MPLASSVISEPVRNFQVAPDGNLYIEPVGLNSLSRTIRIYRPNGLLMGEVVVRAPVAIERSDLLGISRQGWIYLAVNIDVPHKARVLIVSPEGHVIGDLHVPAVPIYAANYGRVLPSGVLYLAERRRALRPSLRRPGVACADPLVINPFERRHEMQPQIFPRHRGARLFLKGRGMRELGIGLADDIDADANHRPRCRINPRLHQNAAKFSACDNHVIGPF